MVRIETPRLLLTELTADDAGFILALLNTPGFLAHIGDRGVRTGDDARRYIAQGPAASYAARGFGLWKVSLQTDGTPVGMSGLIKRDELPFADLGYAFLPAHEGQGYASEAGAAALDFGFRCKGLPRILAIVRPGNEASMRVLAKLGMDERGVVQLDHQALHVFGRDAPRADASA
ncbi:MAG: GNAT family N-acetyltransferase [Arenimonas sp.]|nr:GNAT family N-acetyltransferase [Arenimonas sp.]